MLTRENAAGNRHKAGFTLIELLVTIAVIVIMATIAVPGFQAFSARNEVAAEVMRIKTALAMARNTAISRRTTMTVCPSRDDTHCLTDWTAPLLIIDGRADGGELDGNDQIERVLMESQVDSVIFRNHYRAIRYPANGWPRGYNGTFAICGQHEQAARVILSNFGRARVADAEALTC